MSTHETQQPLLLRIPEVCSRLGLGRSTVYELIRRGDLPTIRIGRAVRVPTAGLETWIAERRSSASS